LPGVQPLQDEGWLSVDDAYAAQMAHRRALLQLSRGLVFWSSPEARDASQELAEAAIPLMARSGFECGARRVRCPDGVDIDLAADHPLVGLGSSLQEDICILQKQGDEHVLTAAVVCFPASWRLSEKVGRPLSAIHATVEPYDDAIAKRVQRLFDGVQPGRPLWRNNFLYYKDPELHQPRSADGAVREQPAPGLGFIRAERQCIFRLPETRAVVFTIHTYVTRNTTA